jgi:hypothetical protein
MKRRAPGLIRSMLVIAAMDVLPRMIGLRRTLRLIGGLNAGGSAAEDLIEATVNSVCTAAAFYPRRALCLEQSLALTWLLRRRGVPAELRIGVQARPFYAHAWVEVDGRALNEPTDLPKVLTPFALRV